MSPSISSSFISRLALTVGASEQALCLLLSLLIGYPLLYIHRVFLRGKNATIQHLFFISSGLCIAVFNYGLNFYHSVVCILATWVILNTIGGSMISVVASFLFQMGYLLVGYYVTGTDTYDIKWTMPHCVLTLRLIALTFDVYDGKRKDAELSKDQMQTVLKTAPTLVEIASQTYFPASFLVGPQFSMRRYKDFIKGTLYPEDTPSPVAAGLVRGLTGILYLSVYQVGNMFFPTDYLMTEHYLNLWFPTRLLVVAVWGKILLYKYVSCWLIAEGVCIMSGLAYSGQDENQKPIWKGCANIKTTLFETARSFGRMINSFNMNTNAWVVLYVYKRLRFLNNRHLSQIGALIFLALWHGFHSGYYVTFSMEFLILMCEKDFLAMLSKCPSLIKFMETPIMNVILFIVMRIYIIGFFGYCLGPFVLLKSKWWWQFYMSTYFIGHVFFGGYWIVRPLVKKGLKVLDSALAEPVHTANGTKKNE